MVPTTVGDDRRAARSDGIAVVVVTYGERLAFLEPTLEAALALYRAGAQRHGAPADPRVHLL